MWHHEKDDDFWDIPFNRNICYGIAVLTNTFTLSKKPDLKLTLTGMARSKATQGIYGFAVFRVCKCCFAVWLCQRKGYSESLLQ